jgi:hypothetical protein
MRYHDSRRVAAQKVEVEGNPEVKAETEAKGSKQKASGLRLEAKAKETKTVLRLSGKTK